MNMQTYYVCLAGDQSILAVCFYWDLTMSVAVYLSLLFKQIFKIDNFIGTFESIDQLVLLELSLR